MLVLYFFYTLKKFAELNCNANVRLFFEVTTLLPPFLVIRLYLLSLPRETLFFLIL